MISVVLCSAQLTISSVAYFWMNSARESAAVSLISSVGNDSLFSGSESLFASALVINSIASCSNEHWDPIRMFCKYLLYVMDVANTSALVVVNLQSQSTSKLLSCSEVL